VASAESARLGVRLAISASVPHDPLYESGGTTALYCSIGPRLRVPSVRGKSCGGPMMNDEVDTGSGAPGRLVQGCVRERV
jgi:hypothetical protein